MQDLRNELEAFFRGKVDLDGLLAEIDRALVEDPGAVAQFYRHIRGLYNRGRLPAQLFSMFEERIGSASRRTGAASSPASGPAVVPPAYPHPGSGAERESRQPPHAAPSSRDSVPASDLPSVKSSAARAEQRTRLAATEVVHSGVPPGGSPHSQQYSAEAHPSPYSSGSGGRPAQPGEPSVGQVLKDRFELVELLGRGGMSVVFKARDRRKVEALDRNPYVALKLLNEDFKRHPESLKTLQREARKAQGLKHPNVISIYDFDKDENGNYFIAMEMLSGSPLNHVIREARATGGMEPREALRIIEQMAGALGAAHRQSPPIVHSDFKPGNVFLTDKGEVKVFDFGIARAARPAGGETAEMTNFDAGVLGALTPTYASPEMLADLEPDPRDDIYALAIVAYELFTGHRPFGRKTTALEAIAADLRPARIKGLNRRQWRGLKRALELERERRTPTVEELIEELRYHRPMMPLYASAGILVAGMSLWFLVLEPVLKEQRGRELLEEVPAVEIDRLPSIVESAADLLPESRDEIYQKVADRLQVPVVDSNKEQALAALEVLSGLPQTIRRLVHARLEGILVERMTGSDREAAARAAELTGQLPEEVADKVYSAAVARFTDAFPEVDDEGVAALIETVGVLPPVRRRTVYARARDPILRHFSDSARRAFSPKDGQFDVSGAREVLELASVLYPDSKTLDDAKSALESARQEALSSLNEALIRYVAERRLLTDETKETVPGTLERLTLLDPDAYPGAAQYLVSLYLEQIRQAKQEKDPGKARALVDTALGFFPEYADLRRERDGLVRAEDRKRSGRERIEQDRALARAQELPAHLIQQALKDLGFFEGAADGVVGPATRRAILEYQGFRGYARDGTLSDAQRVDLIVRAAEAGHPSSQNTLGMMAASGVGVVKNPKEALRWFSSAAEQGDAYGAYNLGIIYRDGIGVDKSPDRARAYFESARAGGHPGAAQALEGL